MVAGTVAGANGSVGHCRALTDRAYSHAMLTYNSPIDAVATGLLTWPLSLDFRSLYAELKDYSVFFCTRLELNL